MLYYAITIENYFDNLTKSKKKKSLKKTPKNFRSFARKLNKSFCACNLNSLSAYVYQLDEYNAKVLGFLDEKVLSDKDLIEYVAKVFNMPEDIHTIKIEQKCYEDHLNTALDSGSFSKKNAGSIRLLMELENYMGNEDNEFSSNDNSLEENVNNVEHPYKELNAMIGLDSVKKLANQIIALSIMDKKRDSVKKQANYSSKHMLFTGAPGSAKTTVARLLAGALKENGVLETGVFVECGRQDLVGKYTGWTAVQVSEKFEEAKGGVLFIDEAYSLVSKDDFGSEAINTIVQEMENHRHDVIVIFAGYEDKMKEFLNNNQGLKSRIAFHVDFPDYDVDELVAIFKKMTVDKGFTMEEEGIKIVEEICEVASKVPDFGNGRFVRNVLEQAIIQQSQRLLATYGKEDVPEIELFSLKKEDINLSYVSYKDNIVDIASKDPIGFVA